MQTQRMGGLRLKGFGVLLLLVFLLMCSNFDVCEGRRGRHWRAKRTPSSSLLTRKKGRGKSTGGGSHHSGGGGSLSSPSPAPAPAPTPAPAPAPTPTPTPSTAKSSPSPKPSHSAPPKASPSAPAKETPKAPPKASSSAPPKASPSAPAKANHSAPPKASPSAPAKAKPSAPPKASPSAPAKASPSAPPKASPSAPAKANPSAPPKASPSAPAKASPSSPAKPSPSTSAKPSPSTAKPSPSPCQKGVQPATFDVLEFGAKGDGLTDDTKAFQAAWAEACKAGSSAVIVPEGYTYLVGPISFSGPYCQPNIVFQLDGTIIAPTSAKPWGLGILQWLEFTKLRGITIQGSGTIEGRGSVWWTNPVSDVDPINMELTTMPSIKPTALRFYGSYNVTVTGITIQNSPQCHLKFDNCEGVEVFNLTVTSPGDSLNTDGIHLQNSRDVLIHQTDMACGDDCVSIQTGCSNVYIHNVNCGPGHGISIGGLGRDNTKACVSNITVRDVNMHNTMTGVRIKTWQGGSGLVQNIRFSNIRVSEVQMPIVIDQFYCDRSTCKNQTSAVALSGVAYENIRGTYTVKPVHFACSESYPCSDISLTQVSLQPLQERYHMYEPFCWHAFGELYTPTVPPIACLQNGKPNSNKIQSDHDSC